MLRLISAIIMILMPIISVSNGRSDTESPFTSRDVIDDGGCEIGECPGEMAPFSERDRQSS